MLVQQCAQNTAAQKGAVAIPSALHTLASSHLANNLFAELQGNVLARHGLQVVLLPPQVRLQGHSVALHGGAQLPRSLGAGLAAAQRLQLGRDAVAGWRHGGEGGRMTYEGGTEEGLPREA